MLALAALTLGYHALSTPRNGPPCRTRALHAAVTDNLDALISTSLPKAVALLREHPDTQLSAAQSAALLDAACELSAQTPPMAPSAAADASAASGPPLRRSAASGGADALADYQREQQEKLKEVYDVLAGVGSLRGYGSVSACALLPAGIGSKALSTEEQLLLTGLPTAAFAPSPGGTRFDVFLGVGGALALSAASAQLGIDVRFSLVAVGAALLADGVVFSGALAESATRALRPAYRTTVREHEAGHFLCAYLLGCPIEACLLDVWRAATDRRFSGAAGTVFFDPELGAAMSGGRLTREIIDRYSVVVMAGIAAEAAQNGQAEGGQADESALVSLLASLDGGRTWDLPRIRNQARWASSQALLLLREHGTAYKRLCEALERGDGVGGCVMAIEDGLTEGFGRNGELPAERRRRELLAKQQQEEEGQEQRRQQQQRRAMARPDMAVDERQAQIAARLAEIKEQLARQEGTWTE